MVALAELVGSLGTEYTTGLSPPTTLRLLHVGGAVACALWPLDDSGGVGMRADPESCSVPQIS